LFLRYLANHDWSWTDLIICTVIFRGCCVNRKHCTNSNTLFHICSIKQTGVKELSCARNLSKQANSQLLEVVDDEEREEEESSEDAGSSISCRLGLWIGAFGHNVGALCCLVPVNVGLDSRALAGVKISNR